MLGLSWLRGVCRHLAMVPRMVWPSCEILDSGTGETPVPLHDYLLPPWRCDQVCARTDAGPS
jgi:hypothetical protein